MSPLLLSPSQIVNPLARQRFMGFGTGAGGGAFSPLDNAKLSEWWSIESLAAVGDGNPISSWVGEKGVYTLGAAGTARPTYEVDDGDGMPAAMFDGVDDNMTESVSNATLFGATGDYEFWFVARGTAGSLRGLMACTGITNQNGAALNDTGGIMSAPLGANNINFTGTTLDSAWHVFRFAKSGARRVVQMDGVSLYDNSTAAGTYGTGNDTLSIGDYFSFLLLGGMRHALFFTDFLTDDEAAEMTAYLEGFI